MFDQKEIDLLNGALETEEWFLRQVGARVRGLTNVHGLAAIAALRSKLFAELERLAKVDREKTTEEAKG